MNKILQEKIISYETSRRIYIVTLIAFCGLCISYLWDAYYSCKKQNEKLENRIHSIIAAEDTIKTKDVKTEPNKLLKSIVDTADYIYWPGRIRTADSIDVRQYRSFDVTYNNYDADFLSGLYLSSFFRFSLNDGSGHYVEFYIDDYDTLRIKTDLISDSAAQLIIKIIRNNQ